MPLFNVKDFYPNGLPGQRDIGAESVTNAASGGVTETMESSGSMSPIKSILIMVGVLVGLRLLWEAT